METTWSRGLELSVDTGTHTHTQEMLVFFLLLFRTRPRRLPNRTIHPPSTFTYSSCDVGYDVVDDESSHWNFLLPFPFINVSGLETRHMK